MPPIQKTILEYKHILKSSEKAHRFISSVKLADKIGRHQGFTATCHDCGSTKINVKFAVLKSGRCYCDRRKTIDQYSEELKPSEGNNKFTHMVFANMTYIGARRFNIRCTDCNCRITNITFSNIKNGKCPRCIIRKSDFSYLKPIFPYVGGKSRLLKSYCSIFNGIRKKKPTHFIDHFGGSGVVSMWIHEHFPNCRLTLNEKNSQIFGIYHAIKFDYEDFIKHVEAIDEHYLPLPVCVAGKSPDGKRKAYYYACKKEYGVIPAINTKLLTTYEAALLYWLMVNNFSGLFMPKRSNGSSTDTDGIYNTAFGNGHRRKTILERYGESINKFRRMIQHADISNKCYRQVEYDPSDRGTVHYFDPPYVDSKTFFDLGFDYKHSRDTELLINHCLKLDNLGHMVVMSNKHHPIFEPMLDTFDMIQISTRVSMSYTVSNNNEVIFHNV